MRRRTTALSVAAVALVSSFAQPRLSADDDVRRAIDRIVERPCFADAWWGIEVRSLRTGKVVYSRNADKNFKPASTLKLVTTAAALDVFGPDDRVLTTLETSGRVDGSGRLLGDIFLVGRGDPRPSLEALADALVASGVKRIEGRLIGHEGLFRGERRGEDWSWGDLVWWYGAEVSALSFHDNVVDLRVSPGERVGDPVRVDAAPVSAFYSVAARAVTAPAGTKPELALERAPGTNTIHLSGTLPLGSVTQELNVALEDPARYATTVLSELLAARGVRILGGIATSSDPLPSGASVLASHQSPPFAERIKVVNKLSQNLHAEILLRLLGVRAAGLGTAAAGQAAVQEFLGRQGIASPGGALKDGSGLSRSDLITPRDLVTLLAAMDRHRHAVVFRDSLPVAGRDGSMKNRMKGTAAEGRVQAKTGGLRQVNALVGYATTVHGERLAFGIVLNNHTTEGRESSAAIDAIVNLLVAR